jgi:hypothetical protein
MSGTAPMSLGWTGPRNSAASPFVASRRFPLDHPPVVFPHFAFAVSPLLIHHFARLSPFTRAPMKRSSAPVKRCFVTQLFKNGF